MDQPLRLDDSGAEADEGLDTVVEHRQAVADADAHGQRLDKQLARWFPAFSRTHLQQLIADGQVRVDGRVARSASARLTIGASVEVDLVPPAQVTAFRAEAIPLDIVHEDPDLMVLHKPAGLVVHPAAGHWSGTLLNGVLAHHAGAAALPRGGIVHRLDKDTSGLMVVAKTLTAMTALARDIAAREVQREYLAIAWGRLARSAQQVDAPIGRDPVGRVRMAVLAAGKPARTDLLVAVAGAAHTGLRCRLHTGRTHQIRVHLAWLGHPLVADGLYGGRPALGLNRQALHATRLAFRHPDGRGLQVFEAPPPPDFAAAWAAIV